MVSRWTNFGERSEPAPDRGGKLLSAGAVQSNLSPLNGLLSADNDFSGFHGANSDDYVIIFIGAIDTNDTSPNKVI